MTPPAARKAAFAISTWALIGFCVGVAGFTGSARAATPNPYDILGDHWLKTPLLDAVPICVPQGLHPELEPVLERVRAGEFRKARKALTDWQSAGGVAGPNHEILDRVLASRAAQDRAGWLAAEGALREILYGRESIERDAAEACLRLELARVLLFMSRASEAAAQLIRAEEGLQSAAENNRHRDEVDFWQAEILYQRGNSFDAHLAYRSLTKSSHSRLALAARLRLTDLSFEAGKMERVSAEYEALLPRASAFGASTKGWARRAAEAAIGVGQRSRAIRWLQNYLGSGAERDDRDLAEIRLADLDLLSEDPLRARKRLSSVRGRRGNGPIGSLAAVRSIDLGLSVGDPDDRLEILLTALGEHRAGLRRYVLSVLMGELAHRNDLDAAFAVATRLAYEGIDPAVTPDFDRELDAMLMQLTGGGENAADCQEVLRALGGRYGILIERSSDPKPFARVGACFEEQELPWLAVTVYRTIARRFGPIGAEAIALPLARSSLAIGEVALARRVAAAALEDPTDREMEWRAVLAEADFIEGRFDPAAEGIFQVLKAGVSLVEEGKLARLLALTFERRNRSVEVDFVAGRIPVWLEADKIEPKTRASFVEAALLTAHAYRRAGKSAEAFFLYREVSEFAEPGALRSSARFWLGLSGEADVSGQHAWGEDPQVTLMSPWARVAVFEKNLSPLWARYGKRGERVR